MAVIEHERRHIARELHDGLGHMLLTHRLDAEWILEKSEDQEARDVARGLCAGLQDSLQMVRNLTRDLRATTPGSEGIGPSLQELAESLSVRSEIHCRCTIELDDDLEMSPEVALGLYRIAQEALSNAVRHAQCSTIDLALRLGLSGFELDIVDDGLGIASSPTQTSSIGLSAMRERAELLAGSLSVTKSKTGGTIVRASIPIPSLKKRNEVTP